MLGIIQDAPCSIFNLLRCFWLGVVQSMRCPHPLTNSTSPKSCHPCQRVHTHILTLSFTYFTISCLPASCSTAAVCKMAQPFSAPSISSTGHFMRSRSRAGARRGKHSSPWAQRGQGSLSAWTGTTDDQAGTRLVALPWDKVKGTFTMAGVVAIP